MNICDYCQKKIDDGYLGNDIYVICDECIKKIYTKEEFEDEYEKGNIFWTTWYDED